MFQISNYSIMSSPKENVGRIYSCGLRIAVMSTLLNPAHSVIPHTLPAEKIKAVAIRINALGFMEDILNETSPV